MKPNFYTYCVLKYQHSPFLDESLNIGVLIYFHDSQNFSFTYSKSLSRIKSVYENVPEKTIKEYLRQIEKKLRKFENEKTYFFQLGGVTDFSSFVYRHILPYDASALKFEGFKSLNQLDYKDSFIEKTIVNKLLIDDFKHIQNQPQEPKIISNLFSKLKESGLNEYRKNNDRFREGYILTNETGTEFKFDVAWQNGTLNLIKPIGFDLKESRSIADKAHRNFGQFYDLQNEAITKKLRYDLILGKPHNRKLFKDYEHAISLLENLSNVKLIDESELKQYSEKIIDAIITEKP